MFAAQPQRGYLVANVLSTKANWPTIVAQHLSGVLGCNRRRRILLHRFCDAFWWKKKGGDLSWDSVGHSVIQKYPQHLIGTT